MPEKGKELNMGIEADYGLKCTDSFAKYDPVTSSWKTYQRCLLEGWIPYSQSFPRAGMMLNGIVYRQSPMVPILSVIECGSLPRVPRPLSMDHKAGHSNPISRRAHNGAHFNLRDWFSEHYNMLYPPVVIVDYLMGFPSGHTDLNVLATP